VETHQKNIDWKTRIETGQFQCVKDLHADLVFMLFIVYVVIVMLGVNESIERECGVFFIHCVEEGDRV
jgi:hypothetical protein